MTNSIREIAANYDIDEADVSRFIPLAFLAPDIVEAIVAGKQLIDLTAERLKRIGQLPHCWHVNARVKVHHWPE